MKILKTFVIFSIAYLLMSCQKENITENDLLSNYAVDGWIENDDYAYVYFTKIIDYVGKIDSSYLRNIPENNAKITLVCENESEILTQFTDRKHFPSYYFRSLIIKGAVGKTYKLIIELNDDTIAQCKTTIPALPTVEKITKVYFKYDYSLMVSIKNIYKKPTFYRCLYREDSFFRYTPALVSNFCSDSYKNDTFNLSFKRGPESYLESGTHQYFRTNIEIKICSQDQNSYKFWEGFNREILSIGNPLASGTNNLNSNVNGCYGVFCGYGVRKFIIMGNEIHEQP